MPTYEYACTNADCGNRFDLVQSFSDPSASECPVCGQPVRKVYGAVGVVFKGSGFYRNDSRDSAQRATATKADSSSSTDAGSGSKSDTNAKSDSKPSSGSGDGGSGKGDSANGNAAPKADKPAAKSTPAPASTSA